MSAAACAGVVGLDGGHRGGIGFLNLNQKFRSASLINTRRKKIPPNGLASNALLPVAIVAKHGK